MQKYVLKTGRVGEMLQDLHERYSAGRLIYSKDPTITGIYDLIAQNDVHSIRTNFNRIGMYDSPNSFLVTNDSSANVKQKTSVLLLDAGSLSDRLEVFDDFSNLAPIRAPLLLLHPQCVEPGYLHFPFCSVDFTKSEVVASGIDHIVGICQSGKVASDASAFDLLSLTFRPDPSSTDAVQITENLAKGVKSHVVGVQDESSFYPVTCLLHELLGYN